MQQLLVSAESLQNTDATLSAPHYILAGAGHASATFQPIRVYVTSFSSQFRLVTRSSADQWDACSPSIVCGGGGRNSHFTYCPRSEHVVANLTSRLFGCGFIRRYGDLQIQSKLYCEILSLVALSLSTCKKSSTMTDCWLHWINTDSANFCRLRHIFISFSLFYPFNYYHLCVRSSTVDLIFVLCKKKK